MKLKPGNLLCSYAAGFGVFALSFSAGAHPYASSVTNNNGAIQFILNEPATSVKVSFDNGTVTNNLGALAKGSNGFSLGSHTNYSIIVYKVGNGAFTQISSDSSNTLNFVAPRGVGVNINPQRPNFGRVYICSPWPSSATNSTATGRQVGQGIYVVNADGSDAFGQGTNALLGNIWLGTSYRYSPYRVFVGPDDSVYVGDLAGAYTASLTPGGSISYSPPGGGVWMASPNFSFTTNLFDTNQVSTVYSGVYGLYVTGSVAASNLLVYALEWDLTGSATNGTFLTPPAVWQYYLGTNDIPYEDSPPGLMTVGLGINGVLGDMTVHPTMGYIYAEQDRTAAAGDSAGTGEANNNNATLYIYDSTGVTNLWESGIGGANVFDAAYGIAVSPDGNWLACATGFGTTIICQITNGIPDLSTVVTNNEETGAVNTSVLVSQRRGVVFDAADNVITSLPQTPGGGNDDPSPSLPAVVRAYSLGLTSIAVTANDTTGTNGTFHLTLLPGAPSFTGITDNAGNLTLVWTSPSATDTIASFTVQSSTAVSGPYANVTPAPTITQPGGTGTAFEASVSASGPTTFYRIHHL
ncbi:MAG TPA: hypothetical protein VGN61_06050 [Verrucomicrobiae bacterium]|jgi:hypothetical protein